MANEDSGPDAGSEELQKKPYHSPKIVKFGSIESLPDAGSEDQAALEDPRLQAIVERWREIPESVKEAISDTIRGTLGD